MFGKMTTAWESGKANETWWWLHHLRETIGQDQNFLDRAAGNTHFEFGHLIAPGISAPRILDVGAGPVTQVGLKHDHLRIDLTAIDPLAKEYNEILSEINVSPVIRTTYGEAEHLDNLFEPDTFDFAFCRNALDHSYHPLEGIWQTVRTLKPGASFFLCGFTNEGEEGRYEGLHQWNFDVKDGRFLIWRPGISIDVAAALGSDVNIVDARSDKRWYMITFTKPHQA